MSLSIAKRLKNVEFPENNYRLVFLVILLGIAVRLFACEYTYIINSDGVLYVNQAKALYYNSFENMYDCGLNYLSIYPPLIAILYPVTGDFLTAAIAVSCIFGSLTLIPIYFLGRRFFSIETSTLITLIYALLPVFVVRSADVLRGSVCWFFAAFGILTAIQYIDTQKIKYILFSFVCFFFSTWARIESIICFPSTLLYLFMIATNKKKVLINCFLIGSLLVLIGICLQLFWGVSILKMYRIDEITPKIIEPFSKYEELRKTLKQMTAKAQYGYFDNFIINVRHQVHFVALGTIISNACEAFFYPFLLFFIAGFVQIRKKIKKDPRLIFFLILLISSLCIIFINLIHLWMIEYRYFALAILASCVFFGFGIESIKNTLSKTLNLRPTVSVACICIFILIFGLSKNLRSREQDKYIYRLMGESIERIEQSKHPVIVASLIRTSVCEKVSFYANRSYEGEICPRQFFNLKDLAGNNYAKLVEHLRNRNVQYFLWEKRWWPEDWFDFRTNYHPKDFIQLMRFQQSGSDQLILYKVR